MAKATKKEQQEVTRRLRKKYPQMYTKEGKPKEKYFGKPVKKTKRTKQAESQLKAAGLTEKDIAKFR